MTNKKRNAVIDQMKYGGLAKFEDHIGSISVCSDFTRDAVGIQNQESLLLRTFYYKDVKLLLRSLDKLTKEITVEGFNEGKPFMPIVFAYDSVHKVSLGLDTYDTSAINNDGIRINNDTFDFGQNFYFEQISIWSSKMVDVLASLSFNVYDLAKEDYEEIND